MDTHTDPEKMFGEVIQERLATLPAVIQNAIKSGDITKHMQKLAAAHKLHIDQWEVLEKEVQYTILGLQPVEELAENIKNEVGVTDTEAQALTIAIADTVFEPIREALERELDHPEAKAVQVSALETARTQAIASETATVPAVAVAPRAVAPATPPPPPPQGVAKRSPIADTYLSSMPSHERKGVDGDPYREQTK